MAAEIVPFGYEIPESVMLDLVCRFTGNVPEEEKVELVRICFQVELAHWFFVDNYCQPDSELDHLAHIPFNIFALQMFEHTPYLRDHTFEVDKACSDFRAYKNKVPVYGAILLTADMKELLLVQGFRNQWGFPKGKVNKEEDEVLCSIREVREETGYNIEHLINPEHYIESSQNDRVTRLYIIVGAEKDFTFRPQTAYEIKEISWFSLDELPENRKDVSATLRAGYTSSNFYTVFSYVRRLKRWIVDKLDGTNELNNFKVSETYGNSSNAEFRSYPDFMYFPNKPTFGIIPDPLSLTISKPHKSSNTVKRKLDFEGLDDDDPVYTKSQESLSEPSKQKSLSLATLFGLSANHQLSGFYEPMEMEDKVQKKENFFEGKGASAWINFKLDSTKMLMPWKAIPSSHLGK